MQKWTINFKILVMTFFIMSISFLIGGLLVLSNFLASQEDQIADKAMIVARTTSTMPEIVTFLQNKKDDLYVLNETVEQIRIINQASYIVVMNMDGVKYSHPVKEQIGEISKSNDLKAAFNEHYYTSIAVGEVGTMLRAFVPILNEKDVQIGVVVVGYPIPTAQQLLGQYKQQIVLVLFSITLFSLIGAYVLARQIKRQMFNLEPVEMSRLYLERQQTFDAMHEGVIAIDNRMNITIFNEQASIILGVDQDQQQILGKRIESVLPDTRLPEIVENNRPVFNQELFINNHHILSNRIPITLEGKNVGAVAIFKDMTEVKNLAEELTGVKAFVQALRVQTHEHKNKLHTITGLLQLGHVDKALSYLTAVIESEQQVTQFIERRFKNEHISGLLVSKLSRAKELNIRLEIDEESRLTTFPPLLDHHDFVVLFGNFIENAFDALNDVQRDEKAITISVDEHDGMLAIYIADNGKGMSQHVQQQMFTQGFSTKDGDYRGIGLYLIDEIVRKGNGTIEVTSEEGQGTSFLVLFELGGE